MATLHRLTESEAPSLREPVGKRLFDLLGAGTALALTWPLILVGAALVKLSSPGPALYRAKRAGLRGRPFDMLKLRTMVTGTDDADRRVTEEEDDRITPVGKLLRALKLDELPQFWNVVRGDMSIVGPRPEDWEIVQRHYTREYRRALAVRPGIVSPADVTWYPDQTYHDPPPAGVPMQEHYLQRHLPVKLEEELRYVETQSLWWDLSVVARTAYCVLVHSLIPPKKRPIPSTDRGRSVS